MIYWHNGILYGGGNGQMSNTSDHMYKFQKYNTEQKPPGQNNTYKQYFF